MKLNNKKLAQNINEGKIAIIPTDTIYGLSASAFLPYSIEKIYRLKKRNLKKPLIIIISGIDDLELFKIKIDAKTKKILEKIWPGKVSVILPCPNKKFRYLHRGQKSLAFRLPDKANLKRLLKSTGPLVSASANPESLLPAKTITDAKKYFGKKVDIYIDEGKLESLPSTLIEIKNEKIKILRQGEVKI
ncbi:MAG TPA: L-threonylcarbamoyladenylate synthase [Candidatus Moranbacteria bacterium]|nr:L-threonylcarbamoyladenylate synthase [Candidatus Moranbacteria bacterium]